MLANPDSGWLEEQARSVPSLFGGYRALMAGVAALWVVMFFVIRRIGRRPKVAAPETPVERAPTFASRIRSLVERAAAGKLSADEKAALERMLITHWQQRLKLHEAGAGELIASLREHAEAGVLLRALEDWLHRPPGRGEVNIEKLLAPYSNLPET